MSSKQPLIMTYEEYQTWGNEATFAEWVPLNNNGKGEVITTMSVKTIHQYIFGFLYALMELYVNSFNMGKVSAGPLEMKLSPNGSAREPDILFVAKENLHRLTNDRLEGPADLVIEIVSGESVKRDRDDKFKEYRDAGVREYWIIDPREGKQRADFFHLDDKGDYELFATEDDEKVESRVLKGLWLKPTWLWEADNRDPFLTFCEIVNIPDALVKQFQAQIQAYQR